MNDNAFIAWLCTLGTALIVLCAGTPDLLDALTAWVGRH